MRYTCAFDSDMAKMLHTNLINCFFYNWTLGKYGWRILKHALAYEFLKSLRFNNRIDL